mgnify:CR=1 FL=1
MKIRQLTNWLGAAFFVVALMSPQILLAQEAGGTPTFKTEELDQLLAPVALYPDDLLSNVLMGSTYPLEVVQAARWQKEPANAKLKGDALAKALEAKTWEPSVKSLVPFPDVLQTMSDKLEWTQKLGDAFLSQQETVMARIQFLRQKADAAGTLKTTPQQKVTKQTNYIVIEPAKPDVVYVPVYQPTVVYGSWWYPAYPPYYWYWGHPASSFASGFFWGAGFAVSNSLWGWGRCDWGHNNIDINVNRYNNINVNGTKITSNTWKHDPVHRGSVPYRDQSSREKFAKTGNVKDARKDFRGFEDGKARDGVKDKLGEGGADKVKDRLGDGGGQKIKDKASDGGADKVKDKLGDGGGQKIKDRAGDGGGQKIKDKAGDNRPANIPSKPSNRDIPRPDVRPASKAMDVKPAADVKRQVDRGSVSRKAAASHPSAGRANAGNRGGGGGGGRPGGGGGRRR